MKAEQPRKLITAAAVLALIVTTMAASAQTQTTDPRIGKLNFENGFPSKETARKLFDEMDYQRAVQAYLWGYPAVSFESIRIGTKRDLGSDLYDMVIADNYADPKGRWLTANDTTIAPEFRLRLARGFSRSCASTAHSNRSSTRAGDRARSSW